MRREGREAGGGKKGNQGRGSAPTPPLALLPGPARGAALRSQTIFSPRHAGVVARGPGQDGGSGGVGDYARRLPSGPSALRARLRGASWLASLRAATSGAKAGVPSGRYPLAGSMPGVAPRAAALLRCSQARARRAAGSIKQARPFHRGPCLGGWWHEGGAAPGGALRWAVSGLSQGGCVCWGGKRGPGVHKGGRPTARLKGRGARVCRQRAAPKTQ